MARLKIEGDGTVRLPDAILDALAVSPGRVLEAKIERGRLVLVPLAREDDPFAAAPAGPDPSAFEKALRKDAEDKARAEEEFRRGLLEKKDLDFEKEREERDRWR